LVAVIVFYWRIIKAFNVTIIKNAASVNLKKTLEDPTIKHIAVLGHGSWNDWEASDRKLQKVKCQSDESVEQKKELFISYTCGGRPFLLFVLKINLVITL